MTEYDMQQQMVRWFDEEGLISDSTPNVAAQENAGNPHYHPSPAVHRAIGPDEILLLDLWGKMQGAWRGLCGHHLGRLHRQSRA